MVDYDKEFEKPAYETGVRQAQIATVFRLAYCSSISRIFGRGRD